jgi:xylose isomerase
MPSPSALRPQAAGRIIADGKLAAFVKNRYASYDKGKGAAFAKGKMSFADLAALAKDYGSVGITSGKQERLENLVNQYLMGL